MSLRSILFILILPFLVLRADELSLFYKGGRVYYAKNESLTIYVDGKLSDEAWKSAKVESLDQTTANGGAPYFKTDVKFLCQKEFLYFSFQCFEEKISALVKGSSERDQIPSKEDFIQLYLQNGDKKDTLYRLVFYPSSGVCDIKIEKDQSDYINDLDWTSKTLESAVKIGQNGWDVEGKISLVELFGKDSDNQPYYKFNVFRSRPQKNWDDLENSSFQQMDPSNFQLPTGMGFLFVQNMKQSLPKDTVEKVAVINHVYNALVALEVPIVDKVIKVDGDISDVIAGGNSISVPFKALKGDNAKLDNLTEAWVLSTKTQLVVAIRCHEKSMDALVSKDKMRDEALWGDDSVEIFLNIGSENDSDYYHIGLNANAAIYDSFKNEISWNGEGILAESKKSKDYWDLEVVIPYLNLDMNMVRKEFGKPWRFNLTRHRPPHSSGEVVEESAWSPTFSEKSHVPEKFGYLFLELMGASINKK